MKDFIQSMDDLALEVKCLFCIPAIAIVWWVYRIVKSLDKHNDVGVILAVVLLIVGIPFMWLFDLICILLKGKVFWID